MRWTRSLPPTVFLLVAVRNLCERLASAPPADAAPILSASAAGSELPWWTPLAVSAVFLASAFIYWWRHRPRRPTGGTEQLDPFADTESGLAPQGTRGGSEGASGEAPGPRFGELGPVPSV